MFKQDPFFCEDNSPIDFVVEREIHPLRIVVQVTSEKTSRILYEQLVDLMVDVTRPDFYVVTTNNDGDVIRHILCLMKFR